MAKYYTEEIPKTERIPKLVAHLYAKMPEIESARAKLITESYKATEDRPIVMRRALAFAHILDNIPIIIREDELVVGSSTIAPRGCQTYPEFSYQWLEAEFDTVATRKADPFYIAEQTKKDLLEADAYWKGKTTSELATALMTEETKKAMEHNIFTPGNYFYNGVGHITVQYYKVLAIGFGGIRKEAEEELSRCHFGDENYAAKNTFLKAVIISCDAVIHYAERYSALAAEMAEKEYLLGNRARELLRYTNQATRIVSDDVSQRDVRAIIKRIAELDDIREVRSVCSVVTHQLDEKSNEGFTKSKFRLYGEDMRQIAKNIVRDVHSANNKHFQTEYDARLKKIDDVLDGCTLLLEYIQICVEEHIISVKKSGVWTKKVTDVKYMAASWRKNDGGRARKLREEAQAQADKRQVEVVKAAIRQYNAERQTRPKQ